MRTLIARAKQLGINYVDEEFPPVEDSLYAPNSVHKDEGPVVSWRRAKDFLEGQIRVFADGITPSDIIQVSFIILIIVRKKRRKACWRALLLSLASSDFIIIIIIIILLLLLIIIMILLFLIQ